MSAMIPDRTAIRRFLAFLGAATVILAVLLASSAVVTRPVLAPEPSEVQDLPLAAASAVSMTNTVVSARLEF